MPLDMDTADAGGDMFFDFRSKILPIECSKGSPYRNQSASDCINGEVIDPDLVVSKLTLTLRRPLTRDYGRCNICLPNGHDPFSDLPCTPGEYICSCGSWWNMYDCTNHTHVGAMNITEAFGHFNNYMCSWEHWIKAPWVCWAWPVVQLTGGMWYSTTTAGWCGAPGADASTCSWDATIDKVVNKTCSDRIIYDAVESYDEHVSGSKCFRGCPQRKLHPFKPRNTSDVCWIYCLYATILGPATLLPTAHEQHTPLGGMPRDQLEAAFEKPFKPLSEGGCADLKGSAADIRAAAQRRIASSSQRRAGSLPPSATGAAAAAAAAAAPWRERMAILADHMRRNAAVATAEGTVEEAAPIA